MKRELRTRARTPWVCGSTSGDGTPHGTEQLSFFRVIERRQFEERGPHFTTPPGRPPTPHNTKFLHGQLNGLLVPIDEPECQRLGLLYGHLQPHGRNYGGYVLSRAARRRGHTTDDVWYKMRAERAAERRRQQPQPQV